MGKTKHLALSLIAILFASNALAAYSSEEVKKAVLERNQELAILENKACGQSENFAEILKKISEENLTKNTRRTNDIIDDGFGYPGQPLGNGDGFELAKRDKKYRETIFGMNGFENYRGLIPTTSYETKRKYLNNFNEGVFYSVFGDMPHRKILKAIENLKTGDSLANGKCLSDVIQDLDAKVSQIFEQQTFEPDYSIHGDAADTTTIPKQAAVASIVIKEYVDMIALKIKSYKDLAAAFNASRVNEKDFNQSWKEVSLEMATRLESHFRKIKNIPNKIDDDMKRVADALLKIQPAFTQNRNEIRCKFLNTIQPTVAKYDIIFSDPDSRFYALNQFGVYPMERQYLTLDSLNAELTRLSCK